MCIGGSYRSILFTNLEKRPIKKIALPLWPIKKANVNIWYHQMYKTLFKDRNLKVRVVLFFKNETIKIYYKLLKCEKKRLKKMDSKTCNSIELATNEFELIDIFNTIVKVAEAGRLQITGNNLSFKDSKITVDKETTLTVTVLESHAIQWI